MDRLLVLLAGLAGAAGVALAAASAHGAGGPNLATASTFLMIHAPALLGLALLAAHGPAHAGLVRAAGFAVACGLALFAGDLALRAYAGRSLFPMAAPIGGTVLIVAWAALAVAAVVPRRRG